MPPPSHLEPYHGQQQHHQHNVTFDIAEALRNPYAPSALNQFQNPYSTHYANAYIQSQPALYTTPEGYTLSSTYDPRAGSYNSPYFQGLNPPSSGRGRGQGHSSQAPRQHTQQNSSWYQAGNARCIHPRCSFSGSPKSVEIHMMDRHLIYPPGWDKAKRGLSWDADPSLKGKIVPIQGTSVILNTPEALDTWMAERKRRWPTAQRVKEKNLKMEEAMARGQLPLMDSASKGRKRRYEGDEVSKRNGKRSNMDETNQRYRPRTLHTVPREPQTTLRVTPPPLSIVSPGTKSSMVSMQDAQPFDSGENDSGENEAPEILSSKTPIKTLRAIASDTGASAETVVEPPPKPSRQIPRRKEPMLPRNPFASRPTLLRNLLLPEIRVTVSNLSQAIRFLVDNDFLRDVELEPGQANHSLIEVLGSREPADALHQSHRASIQ